MNEVRYGEMIHPSTWTGSSDTFGMGVRSLILAFVFPTSQSLGLREATRQPMVLVQLRLKYPYAQVLEGVHYVSIFDLFRLSV